MCVRLADLPRNVLPQLLPWLAPADVLENATVPREEILLPVWARPTDVHDRLLADRIHVFRADAGLARRGGAVHSLGDAPEGGEPATSGAGGRAATSASAVEKKEGGRAGRVRVLGGGALAVEVEAEQIRGRPAEGAALMAASGVWTTNGVPLWLCAAVAATY